MTISSTALNAKAQIGNLNCQINVSNNTCQNPLTCFNEFKSESANNSKYVCLGVQKSSGQSDGKLFKCSKNVTNVKITDSLSKKSVSNGVEIILDSSAITNYECKIVSASNTGTIKQGDCVMNIQSGTCKNPGSCFDKGITQDSEGNKFFCYGRQNGWLASVAADSTGYLVKCTGDVTDINEIIYDDGSWTNLLTGNPFDAVVDINADRVWKNFTLIQANLGKYGCTKVSYQAPALEINTNVGTADQNPLNPFNLIRSVTNFLYYFAIFYFVVLILVNSISYIRSAEDPSELKKIKESLFNTIAGFLFVLLSGSVIVYILSQIAR